MVRLFIDEAYGLIEKKYWTFLSLTSKVTAYHD